MTQEDIQEFLNTLDDKVDTWHRGNTGMALHNWLRLTPAEYREYVEQPTWFARKKLAEMKK